MTRSLNAYCTVIVQVSYTGTGIPAGRVGMGRNFRRGSGMGTGSLGYGYGLGS